MGYACLGASRREQRKRPGEAATSPNGERSLRRREENLQRHCQSGQATLQRTVLNETALRTVSYGVCLWWGDRQTASTPRLQSVTAGRGALRRDCTKGTARRRLPYEDGKTGNCVSW